MFIVCPSCTTKYLVDPSAIGKAGRDVRCAKCSNSWFQAPPDEMPDFSQLEEPNQRPRPIPKGSGLPVAVEMPTSPPAWFKALTGVLAVSAAVVALVCFSDALRPSLGGLYDMFGVTRSDGLALADIDLKKTPAGKKKDKFLLKFSVLNESKEDRVLPLVRVTIYNDTKSIEPYYIEPKETVIIKPGESHDIEQTLYSDIKTATNMRVELGNSIDLMKRH